MNKILITGCHGFLAGHLVNRFESEGYEVYKAYNINANRAPFWGKEKLDWRPTERCCNLLDKIKVDEMLVDFKPDIVIHCAAKVGGILFNKNNPAICIYDNLIMGLNLIEASRLNEVKKFVNIGTICSYPANPPTFPFIETDLWKDYPTEITAPYGIAKKCLHETLRAYRKQYKFNGISVMPTNLYGPKDHFNTDNAHIIPSLIKKFHENDNNVKLLGDGTATRELIYIDDAVEAIKLCVEKYDDEEPINIGTGEEYSIHVIAETINRLMGKNCLIDYDMNNSHNGQQRRRLNISKLTKLGFSSKIGLEEGLKRTIKYYESTRTN